jgi:hypothetical protein
MFGYYTNIHLMNCCHIFLLQRLICTVSSITLFHGYCQWPGRWKWKFNFYVLAPLFFLIFLIPSAIVRRIIYLIVIVFSSYYWFDYWGIGNVFVFLRVFFIGILLADLHCTKTILIKNNALAFFIGLLSLTGFFSSHLFITKKALYIMERATLSRWCACSFYSILY